MTAPAKKPRKQLAGNEGLGCKLQPKQEEAIRLLGRGQRHTLLVGGARSGKTFILLRAVLVRALKAPDSRHAIMRLRNNALRQSIWLDTLPKVAKLCFPGVELEYRERDGFVRLPNGSEIWMCGLDDKERVEKILGMEFCTLYFVECSQIPWSSVVIALTRLAQKVEGLKNRAYYDLNPTGTGHWTYRLFIEHRNPGSDRETLEFPANYAHMYLNPADNAPNIDPEYLASLQALPERQRRRFFDGQYVAELDGALWTLGLIETNRRSADDVPAMNRVIIAIDPSGARGQFDTDADAIGLIAAGMGVDGHAYVLEDRTGHYSPEAWAQIACQMYRRHNADRIVAERNFGGDMVRAVIQGSDPNVPYRDVTASRGKWVRAEPIAALYEQGKVHHVGRFPDLEDELGNFTTAGYVGDRSPNRADALVWAMTELFGGGTGLFEFWRQQVEAQAAQVQPSPAVALAGYQKEHAEEWDMKQAKVQQVGKLGKLVTTPQQPNICPGCGNRFLSLYAEGNWKCGACGISGTKEDLKVVTA